MAAREDNEAGQKDSSSGKRLWSKAPPPGPTLFRICTIIIFCTLDVLIPTALLYAEYDQQPAAFFDAEFFNGYAVAISGIDISFICLFRALFSSVFGFFLGLWMPVVFSVQSVSIVLLLLKSVLVVPSWWSGYRTAIFICSLFFGLYLTRSWAISRASKYSSLSV